METSAKNNVNVDEAFFSLATDIKKDWLILANWSMSRLLKTNYIWKMINAAIIHLSSSFKIVVKKFLMMF